MPTSIFLLCSLLARWNFGVFFMLGENTITSSLGTKSAAICARQGDQPKRLVVNKGLIQYVMISEIIQVGFYPTRRSWLFQEDLLWHFLLASVFMQSCSSPGPVFTLLQLHVLAFAEICHHSVYTKISAQTDFIFTWLAIKTHPLTSGSPAGWRTWEGKMPFIPALQSWSF